MVLWGPEHRSLTTVKVGVFNKDLKMPTEGPALILMGRLFHRWVAATEKARLPQSLLEHEVSAHPSLSEGCMTAYGMIVRK